MRKFVLLLVALAFVCRAAHAQTESKPEPKPAPDARIKKILDDRKIEYDIMPSGNFQVVFNLKSGRHQVAFISSATYRYMNLDIREIVSPAYRSAAPLPADIANRLLSDNNDKKLGAWAIQKDKEGYFAVFVTKVQADSSMETFINSLRLTLDAADAMEQELTNKDQY